MAIAFDAKGNNSGSGTSITLAHTIGSGSNRMAFVSTMFYTLGADPTITATYNGVSCTLIDRINSGTSPFLGVAIFYILHADLPSAGTYNVVVSFSESVTDAAAGCSSYTGVAQQAPEATAEDTDASKAITTITNNAWILTAYGANSNTGGTPGTGQTERYDQASSFATLAQSDEAKATAGSDTQTYTSGGSPSLEILEIAAFAEVAPVSTGASNDTDPRIFSW